ncbi:hypothetical protein ACCT03_34425 [Rhizobium johnstonii]|uniref:hypothetical protein n=1 Tax=Rhizobium johnstonii TaxID=3019933 RepID=UPI003F9DACA3
MSDAQKEVERRDAFTLSMVDLFGCGFIAAIFLFILNLIQPQIDALVTQGSVAGTQGESAGALAGATSGPVFITIRADQELTFPDWSDAPTARVNPEATDPLDRFVYDQVVPDAGKLQWPKSIPLLPVANLDTPIDAEITMVLGRNVSVVRLVDWVASANDGRPFKLAFNYRKGLYADIATPMPSFFSVDIVPDRASNAAYAGQLTILSTQPVTSVIGWIGAVDRLTWQYGEQATVAQPSRALLACWLRHTGLREDKPVVICPEDNTEISSLVGGQPSRIRAFVASADQCVAPFAGWSCKPPSEYVPERDPPEELLDRRHCIGSGVLSHCFGFSPLTSMRSHHVRQ